MGQRIEIPRLAFEFQQDGSVLIEQDHGGDRHFVDLCPAHLKALGDLLDRPMVARVVHLRNRILALHEQLDAQVGYPGRVRIPEADDSEQLLELADLLLDELGVPSAPAEAVGEATELPEARRAEAIEGLFPTAGGQQ